MEIFAFVIKSNYNWTSTPIVNNWKTRQIIWNNFFFQILENKKGGREMRRAPQFAPDFCLDAFSSPLCRDGRRVGQPRRASWRCCWIEKRQEVRQLKFAGQSNFAEKVKWLECFGNLHKHSLEATSNIKFCMHKVRIHEAKQRTVEEM